MTRPEIGTVLRAKNMTPQDAALQDGDLCVVVAHADSGWRFQAFRSGFALTLPAWPHYNFEVVNPEDAQARINPEDAQARINPDTSEPDNLKEVEHDTKTR